MHYQATVRGVDFKLLCAMLKMHVLLYMGDRSARFKWLGVGSQPPKFGGAVTFEDVGLYVSVPQRKGVSEVIHEFLDAELLEETRITFLQAFENLRALRRIVALLSCSFF